MNRGGVSQWSGGKEMSGFDYNSNYGNHWNSGATAWDGMGSSNLINSSSNSNNFSTSYGAGLSSNVSGYKRQWQSASPGEEKKSNKMIKLNQSYGSQGDQYGSVDAMYSNQSGQYNTNWNDSKRKSATSNWGSVAQYNNSNSNSHWQGKSPQKGMKNFGYQAGYQGNDYCWDYSAEQYVDESDFGEFGAGYFDNQGAFDDYYVGDQAYQYDQKQRGGKFGGRGQRGSASNRGGRIGNQPIWGQWLTDENSLTFGSAGSSPYGRGRRGAGRGGGGVGSEINRIRDAIRTVQGYSDIDLSFLLDASDTFRQGNQYKGKSGRGAGVDAKRGAASRGKLQRGGLANFGDRGSLKAGLRNLQAAAKGLSQGVKGKNAKASPLQGVNLPADTSKMTISEKIKYFTLWLKRDYPKCNAIQTIENALTSCKLKLDHSYDVEELVRIGGRSMYTAKLTVEGKFMARAVAASKKELKHEVYKKAVEVLTKQSVASIVKQKDPGPEKMRAELTNSLTKNKTEPSWEKVVDICKEKGLSCAPEKTFHGNEKQVGFQQLIAQLKATNPQPDNEISAFIQAFSASHCTLEHTYTPSDSRLANGKAVFYGTVTIGNVVVGRGMGCKKKDAKHEAYKQAIEFIKNNALEIVMKGNKKQPVEHSGFNISSTEVKSPKTTGETATFTDLSSKLEALIKLIKESAHRANTVNAVDTMAVQCCLSPTCLYRKVEGDMQKRTLACELYLDNLLIAKGEGDTRKDAQIGAYTNAWEVLSTSTPNYLISEHHTLTMKDKLDPMVIDIVVKGFGKYGESNLPRLRRLRIQSPENSKSIEDLVIMEHEDWKYDRQRHAFCILNNSSTMCGMLMEWEIEPQGDVFKCKMLIQKKLIAEASASSKNNARNTAAAIALMKLYQTQDVIRIVRRDDSTRWIPYEQIVEQGKVLENECSGNIDLLGGLPIFENLPENKDGKNEKNADSDGLNKFAVKYMEQLMNEYVEKETLDDLIFGPGITSLERKVVTNIAFNLHLKMDVRQHEGKNYLCISKKLSPEEISYFLKVHNTGHGKYVLVPKVELPGSMETSFSDNSSTTKTSEISNLQGKKDFTMDVSVN
ncbi:uncharacterized protein LOC115215926 [Octopus sinensis]|uniref:Uncharacterized protein LOC115215926 n=1 Tax=Octopus sinensis TaxID=2607531 RepID=A0A6P7SSB0_9MOLL|nr:uncharacterized protein LOC115215926 [Octopus sinensis]XP_029641158.1 uncharacterized protein LOC115215926 [Octopus sinensis]XP_029641166.1 uncharacterized protein LOC115215926 [Octopus sinensis]XP_029641175.1 uncharacterized protein LOC115215926 [Octopus sinensis]XP_029641186.1 uncharacterized protein LOC115215926 [Octopus sinensis]XP_029641192.1 uncharacterized protein LOC115215926 [Octopus sinensis]